MVGLDESGFISVLLTVKFHLKETGKPARNKYKLNFGMLKPTQMRFSLNLLKQKSIIHLSGSS